MEPQSVFDLNLEILNWKNSISSNCTISADNVLELESHLLDEIDSLKQFNLTDEEAFFVAQKRIGAISDLKVEYAKVNTSFPFIKKLEPFLFGILAFLAFTSFADFSSKISATFQAKYQFLSSNGWEFFHPTLLVLLACSTLLILYLGHVKKLNFVKKVLNFPFLIGFIVVSKILQFGIFNSMVHDENFNVEVFAESMQSLHLFHAAIILIVIGISIYTYFYYKKLNSLTPAES